MRTTNIILAALAAGIWTAVFVLPAPAEPERATSQPPQARYCVVPGTGMAALCRDVPAERAA